MSMSPPSEKAQETSTTRMLTSFGPQYVFFLVSYIFYFTKELLLDTYLAIENNVYGTAKGQNDDINIDTLIPCRHVTTTRVISLPMSQHGNGTAITVALFGLGMVFFKLLITCST
jgi:hypothetical protein